VRKSFLDLEQQCNAVGRGCATTYTYINMHCLKSMTSPAILATSLLPDLRFFALHLCFQLVSLLVAQGGLLFALLNFPRRFRRAFLHGRQRLAVRSHPSGHHGYEGGWRAPCSRGRARNEVSVSKYTVAGVDFSTNEKARLDTDAGVLTRPTSTLHSPPPVSFSALNCCRVQLHEQRPNINPISKDRN